jgi:hypothetical protein
MSVAANGGRLKVVAIGHRRRHAESGVIIGKVGTANYDLWYNASADGTTNKRWRKGVRG